MRNLCFHRYFMKKCTKTLELTIFVSKIIYLGYVKVQLWTTPITKVRFLKIVTEHLLRFQKLFSFLKNRQICLSYACFCILSDFLQRKIRPFHAVKAAVQNIFLPFLNHFCLFATLKCLIIGLSYNSQSQISYEFEYPHLW